MLRKQDSPEAVRVAVDQALAAAGYAEVLDFASAGEALQINDTHLRRLVLERRIAFTKVGGRLRFLRSDLAEHLASNRTPAAS